MMLVSGISRIKFELRHLCDHSSVMSSDPFSICYRCGTPRWKCEIDIEKRKIIEMEKFNNQKKQEGAVMTTKPWGDEPAMPFQIEHSPFTGDDGWNYPARIESFSGFTKLERACIDLKVPHPDLPPELRELILESRRLDSCVDRLRDIDKSIMSNADKMASEKFAVELDKK